MTATLQDVRTIAPPVTPALYDAVVTHFRRGPIDRRFSHRTFYWLIDIDNPPRRSGLRRMLVRHNADDHVDVRQLLADSGIVSTRILMLAHPRTLGRAVNPLSMYWCYDGTGAIVAVVAEVHNTYGERHPYLLHPDDSGRAEVSKQMYVSPFYPVDGHYEIKVSEPSDHLAVSVALDRAGTTAFIATLTATRRPFTSRELVRASARYPLVSLRTATLIRWHGIRLWLRGLPVQPR